MLQQFLSFLFLVSILSIAHVLNYVDMSISRQSFTRHLLQLMTSWAVICDVWYLEPQNLKPDETPIEFAERQPLLQCVIIVSHLKADLIKLWGEAIMMGCHPQTFLLMFRVRGMISVRAGLKKAPWDGYLKYSRPSSVHTERKYVLYFLHLLFLLPPYHLNLILFQL